MIQQYKLSNNNGISIVILSLGGIIKEINVPDKSGNFENIVLSYKNNYEYISDPFFMGAIIGRYANRIENGKFRLNEIDVNLEKNEVENHLHGGNNGFHKQNWKLLNYDSLNHKFLELSYRSVHLEAGYPGNLDCAVKYSLNDENEFKIEFYAKSDMDTIFNPTSHSYFNLNPSKNSILNHKLKINAKKFISVNEENMPIETFSDVNETPFDFINAKRVGADINKQEKQLTNCKGYDHCYVLNKSKTNIAAELYDENSCRKLIIKTDQPGIQLYSGNFLKEKFNKYQGLCLETQNFPNSPNIEIFPSPILRKNKDYYSKTSYHFSTI